jgi:phage tail sheath protein FI
MPNPERKTPGVYIEEVSFDAHSVVPIPTAVPAFIGYTPKASFNGNSFLNKAIKISSFAEFQTFFCLENLPKESPVKQYSPQYYVVEQKPGVNYINGLTINGKQYAVLPDPGTIYYLFNSIRLFYENGGGHAYIVSVGTYGAPSRKPLQPGAPLENPNVFLNDLLNGLNTLEKVQEPTIYVCPEATLLSEANNGTLMQKMLLQNADLGTAISIFDIIGAKYPDPVNYVDDIQTFRDNTGINGLGYGAAYYPFVATTIMQTTDLDFNNFFGGKTNKLRSLLSPANAPDQATEEIFAKINKPDTKETPQQLQAALLLINGHYKSILNLALEDANLLPPSGGMAGIMNTVDSQTGVWKAPANVSMVGVKGLTINLNDNQQGDLNVDALTGKSINALRKFPGVGILVWGARTLDGNSIDWKYIPVRRTMIFIEQSCKIATQAFVFEPNDQNTWASVKGMIEDFLTGLWKQGGLAGSKPSNAFAVRCGLGSTMTEQDILQSNLIVQVQVALVHPAEFIAFSFSQKMVAPLPE